MAMAFRGFGNGLPSSPFDVTPTGFTPGFGDAQPGAQGIGVSDAGPSLAMASPQIEQISPNIGGGFGRFLSKVPGALMDIGSILQDVDGGDRFGALQQQRARQQQEDRLIEQQRLKPQQDWEQWRRQYDYQVANPKAAQDTEFERLLSGGGFTEAQKVQLRRQKAENSATAPPLVVPNADGTRTIYPAGSIPRGGDPAPTSGPDWLSDFTPEEIAQMQGLSASRRAKNNVPSGSPLSGAANTRTIGGKQYWNIGGEWYDNPEGR